MSARTKSLLAGGLGALALLFLLVNGVLVWTVDAAASAGRSPAASLWLLGLAGAPVVGVVIAGRRPDNRYGWLLLSFAVTSALLELTELYALYALETYGETSAAGAAGALVSQMLWGATVGHLPMLLLYFPDGRLPSPGWRWLATGIMALTLSGISASLFVPGDLGVVAVANPLGVDGPGGKVLDAVVAAAVVGIFLGMFPAAASLFVRRRRAGLQERMQLRWFSYAATVLAATFVVSGFGGMDEVATNLILMLALLGLFGAIGVAVLRYRLYDIDRVISRTVSYALLTVLVVGVYLSVVTALTQATSSVTGQSPLAVAASTLVAAAMVGPARLRIQRRVDRRFNRAHYDAARAVDAYRLRLRDEIEMDTLSDALLAVVHETVQPRGSQLWLSHPRQVAS